MTSWSIKKKLFYHDDSVVADLSLVSTGGCVVVVGLDLDVVDIVALVRCTPQLANDLINLTHSFLKSKGKKSNFEIKVSSQALKKTIS